MLRPENLGPKLIVMDALNLPVPETAKEIFVDLETEYNNADNIMLILQAKQEFNNLEFAGNETATSFIMRILEAKQALAILGQVVSDNTDCLGVLLNAMDKSGKFDSLSAALRAKGAVTWLDAKTTVLAAESTIRGNQQEKANLARPKPKNTGTVTGDRNRQKQDSGEIVCQICEKPGHSAKKCYHRFKGADEHQANGSEKRNKYTADKDKKDMSEVECFKCHQMGHFASNCNTKKAGSKRDIAAWDDDEQSDKE